ncbi:MAG TPA: hypothetical protein VHO72_17145 [Bacteroidales bacterium]|nr:hypothetical protein [Bacteroidales bacterium]
MDNNHDIEKLFSGKLKNYQVAGSDADWQKISRKLGRNNFLKFSVVTFNIYYLSAIILFAGAASYSGVRNYTLNHKVQNLESSIEVYHKTGVMPNIEENIDTAQVPEPEQQELIQSTTIPSLELRKVAEPTHKADDAKERAIADTAITPKADTTKIEMPKESKKDSIMAGKRVKRVKKTVYVKPSDVIKRDTVIISKPRK